MIVFDRPFWMRTLTGAAIIGATVFGAVRLAVAVPGGETRNTLSFAGTLTGATGTPVLLFTFRKGSTTVCTATTAPVTLGPGGQFATEVPLGSCPSTLFDGSDVVVDVSVAGTTVVMGGSINPVPYARYADMTGSPLCPARYQCEVPTGETGWTCDREMADALKVRCVRKRSDGVVYDDVVRVGTGNTAFWIDRFESSAWQNPDGTGTQYGTGGVGFPDTFPPTGQAVRSRWVYATSVGGVFPWFAAMTWFQADLMCRASGKRLPDNAQWQFAAQGTSDPGANNGADGRCRTMAGTVGQSGAHSRCASTWGAQDMIGNAPEIVEDWSMASAADPGNEASWSNTFGDDLAVDLSGSTFVSFPSERRIPSPAAVRRGGAYADGTGAGLFYTSLHHGVAFAANTGLRCMIPR